MAHDEHPRYRHAAWALGLLTALNLFNFIDRYVLPGVQPLVQHEFHATDERMGALTYAFFITYMLAAPLTGWLGDRMPRKPLVVAGAVLWSVATLLTATVHSYGQLYFRHAIVGIGEATFSVFAPAMIADMYPERIRNKVLSIFYLEHSGRRGAGISHCGSAWLDVWMADAVSGERRPWCADRDTDFLLRSRARARCGGSAAGDADAHDDRGQYSAIRGIGPQRWAWRCWCSPWAASRCGCRPSSRASRVTRCHARTRFWVA